LGGPGVGVVGWWWGGAPHDRWAIAVTLNNVGNLALDQGRTDEARSCLEEAVSLQREVGDRWMTGNALNNLGNVARAQGDYEGALALYGESLAIYRDLEDKWALAYLFEDVAWMAALRGAGRCALRLVGAAAVLREQIGAPLTPTETKKLDSALEPARASLSEADQAEALAEGREMTLEGAMDCAIGDAAHH
jgi:tetratricopeptide (TPR) repeat protein